MASARLGRLVWPAAIAAGCAIGAYVLVAWPEPTTRTVRLPYGEALPKTPREAARPARSEVLRPARAAAAESGPLQEPPAPLEEEEPSRVLAGVEPDQSFAGPAPFPSRLERDPNYAQEPPEQLGAEPLPGAVLTPAPQPVAR